MEDEAFEGILIVGAIDDFSQSQESLEEISNMSRDGHDGGEHDTAEERENDTRRDDSLEREFGSHSEEMFNGRESDRNVNRQRNDILFSEYIADRRKAREREDENQGERAADRGRNAVQRDDRGGLDFRAAGVTAAALGSLQGEIATVGDEEEENVPDEDNANTGRKA